MSTKTIYDFTKQTNSESWDVVDDTVMGGRSNGNFRITEEGHGLFHGYVTTENNGGFSSIQHKISKVQAQGFTKVAIMLKGDGKDYQFRIKAKSDDYYSYIATFSTSGDWEEIIIPLEEMHPSYRGRDLNMSNFNQDSFEQITFLIGNKKKQNFELMIDKIQLK